MSNFERADQPMAEVRYRPITENERAWIEFIRLISGDSDPPPTLRIVQGLRQILTGGRHPPE